MTKRTRQLLLTSYQRLFKHFGPQSWWPASTSFEVIIGAILTQNTAWTNVEKAIKNLKQHKVLSPKGINTISCKRLASLIKPSGYFNIKARRLKNFVSFLYEQYGGDIVTMRRQKQDVLREQLLRVNGIGPETADSILLYAFNKPAFVVDAYTKRWLYRHNLAQKDVTYHALQQVFTQNFSCDVSFFNEYHALIVALGKEFCRPQPRCEKCPLNNVAYSIKHTCPICHRHEPSLRGGSPGGKVFLCEHCR